MSNSGALKKMTSDYVKKVIKEALENSKQTSVNYNVALKSEITKRLSALLAQNVIHDFQPLQIKQIMEEVAGIRRAELRPGTVPGDVMDDGCLAIAVDSGGKEGWVMGRGEKPSGAFEVNVKVASRTFIDSLTITCVVDSKNR